jgi:hypothetical protein
LTPNVVAGGRICALDSFLLHGVGGDESGLGVSEECGSGLSAGGIFESLTGDGVDVGV